MTDGAAPSFANGRGALMTSDGWLSGTQSVGFDANDGSGVQEATVLLDGKTVAQHSARCDFTQRSPCPQATVNETFPTAGLGADGDHVVVLRATDAAGNAATVSRTVHIDNTPPDAPSALTVDGGDGWRQTNSFDVHWTAPAPQAAAPIAAASWQLCPTGATTGCVKGTQAGADITSLTGLRVPAPGAWTLSVWLVDAAGNQDQRLAAPPVTLRFDDTSPVVALEPLSADDPTLITAPATDSGSGIAGGTISIRRMGSTTWTALPTTVDGGALAARLDDEHLADGTYELQAVAQDAAGNQRAATTFTGGQPAQITLPLRLKTRLRAGVVQRSGHHVRLVRAAYAGYGRLVRVRGRLTTPEGNPMQGVPVQAYSRVRDATSPPRLIATVTTSKTGRFSFLVRRGPSRSIQIRYAGAAQIRSATQQVILNVRAATSIRPDRHSFVNGETVRFTGRVRTGRIPEKGKLVALEVLVRGRWRTFATTHASRRGRWRYDYRFDGTRGLQQYRFRAALPREAGYPFAAGGSRIVRVRVRGV
ncbi:Ig-like domain repeat protein [Paraconexibacter antarcticus]|uniref:Ig-like domain repeat protein n=1 Tax=Paraconexibacter antarcticus TaxID=2949664 RepID=A0ABY5DXS0_9ACTN|nr:Ig-like domain repeat protein [Paraconexibacter antarcticus]UTI66133.1 Ig-like domain repeat protein [Paraconexibacter antarcticus]